jgi:hypothetical protein
MKEYTRILQEELSQYNSNKNYELEFWSDLVSEQRQKIEYLKLQLQESRNKCKECGIGNDHKA